MLDGQVHSRVVPGCQSLLIASWLSWQHASRDVALLRWFAVHDAESADQCDHNVVQTDAQQSVQQEVHHTVVPTAAGQRCPACTLCIEQAVLWTHVTRTATHLGNAPKNSCPQPSSVSISEKAVRMRSEMCDEIAPIVKVTAHRTEIMVWYKT